MKYFLFTLLLFSTPLGAQDLSKCERLMDYQYSIIDSLPLSKIEIYHKVHLLLADWYPGYPAIIQMADSNSGLIMISGYNSIEVPTGYKKQTVFKSFNHRMKIECRENKLRIGIFYQTIAEEHGLYMNAQSTAPLWVSDKQYAKILDNYRGNCERLQLWIDQTVIDFRTGIIKPADNW